MNTDSRAASPPTAGSQAESNAASPGGRRGGGFGRALLLLVVVVLLGILAWTWFTLSWSYSEGDRGGVLQKFSRKGWICKTYEGELAMYIVAGVAPQIWQFSVRDPQVAAQLGKYVGERVQLSYTEHLGVPTRCFAETSYFVDGVLPAPLAGAATMGAPAAAGPGAAPASRSAEAPTPASAAPSPAAAGPAAAGPAATGPAATGDLPANSPAPPATPAR